MNKPLLSALAALLLVTGCATRGYVITLNTGERITTPHKPKLVNGFYYFKDAHGNPATPIFSGRVYEVAPASMASPPPNAFNATPEKR